MADLQTQWMSGCLRDMDSLKVYNIKIDVE